MGENIETNFFYTFVWELAFKWQIFMFDGSYDVDSCKDVPFEGLIDIAIRLVDQITQTKTVLRAWIVVFKPNVPNIETFHTI